MKRVFQITNYVGKIKEVEVISCTLLPEGGEVYNLKNHGYIIFGKKGDVEKGGHLFCLGLTRLNQINSTKVETRINSLRDDLASEERDVNETRTKIAEYLLEVEERQAFIDNEIEKYNAEIKSRLLEAIEARNLFLKTV